MTVAFIRTCISTHFLMISTKQILAMRWSETKLMRQDLIKKDST